MVRHGSYGARPWPKRPVSEANKSGNDHAAPRQTADQSALAAIGWQWADSAPAASVGAVVQLACMVMPEGPVDAVVRAAVAAEGLGCSRVWIPDEGLAARECWVTLGAVAAATGFGGGGHRHHQRLHPASGDDRRGGRHP